MTVALAVNLGSSSVRTALFADGPDGEVSPLARADVPALHDGTVELTTAPWRAAPRRSAGSGDPLLAALQAYDGAGLPVPDVVGHRIVHGGPDHDGPVRLTDTVVAELRTLAAWAPLHQAAALAGVARTAARLPGALQVGCFDTAFHRTMPEVAQRLPLPPELWAEGVRRYGFHGLSYEHVVRAVGAQRLGRAVLAHLGSGSSLCAVRDGRSLDTTMGFTPDGGVPMGTRSGDLDPGVLLHLLRGGRSLEAVRALVETRGGLAGLSGGEADMRALLARDDVDARRAVEGYCRAVAKAVGALVTVLGGLDTLVFTGGIGQHAAPVRTGVLDRLAHLGVPERVRVLVVPADEESVLARQALAVHRAAGAEGPGAAVRSGPAGRGRPASTVRA